MDIKILFLLTVFICQTNAVNYTVTASEKFRPNSVYKFIVTIYGVSSANYRLNAKIKNTVSGKLLTEGEFLVEPPGFHSAFELKIPRYVQQGDFIFQVETSGDVAFNKSHRIQLLQKSHSLFIQTDKYLYKPGQTVLFRVLGVQANLKPYTNFINTTIYDQSGNKIYEQLNKKNESGVVSGRLKLSNITPLGQWKIESKSESLKIEAFFEVAEYVLPKFEVKVLLPSYVFVNRNNPSLQQPLHVTVTATYTFGKPVKGYALFTIKSPNRRVARYRNNTPLSKNVELVDGKADVTVPIEELKELFPDIELGWYSNYIFAQANVTEAATGVILQGNNTIPIKGYRFELKFLDISSNTYKPGFPYRAHIKLSQADGMEPKLSDIKYSNGTFKSILIKVDYRNFFYAMPGYSNETLPNASIFQLDLTANGYVSCEVLLEFADKVILNARFYDEEAGGDVIATKNIDPFQTRDKIYIQLSLHDNDTVIKPNSRLTFKVKSSEAISSYQYEVLGKGSLIHSDFVHLETPSNNNQFSILFDEQMVLSLAPQANIVVYHITSTGELVADSISLSITDYMVNKVSLHISPKSTSPGEEVVLRVNASQDSFVSLSAVDQSVLLLSSGNDITQEMLYKDLKQYTSGRHFRGDDFMSWRFCRPVWLGGTNTKGLLDNSGLFIWTNFHVSKFTRRMPIRLNYPMRNSLTRYASPMRPALPMDMPESAFPSQTSTPHRPRKNFPETWIWNDVQTGSDGLLEIKYKVPDTITSWVANAFATSNTYGLGITEYPTKVTVIKPFFISLNLPYSTIRGEQFALQVTIFNYYGEDLTVTVTLPKSNYFHVKQCVQGSERHLHEEEAHTNIFVKNNDMVTIYFWIVPTSLGQIPIEVRAVTAVAADSLITNLLVKPEGQPQSYSSSSLIRLPSDDLSVINFEVSLPPSEILVQDSVIIEATLIGDVMGTTINNLDNLLQMPYGCGEQNMITLAPDVYIVKYLTSTNQLTEDIKNKALEFINAGYQRELTYQRRDGSFSAFGDNDEAGSVWLSAFVIKVFSEAQDIIPVDEIKIAKTLRWILQHQSNEGAFAEPTGGKVLHTAMQGGASSGIGLTAYVLISLLTNKDVEVDGLYQKIALTVTYLEEQYETRANDPYVLSIIGYALYLAGSSKLNGVLERLNSLAVQESGLKHWHKEVPGEDSHSNGWRPTYLSPQTNDIEMTSYVLLIYASQLRLTDSIPIAKWLISKRNPEGGFSSTQDTVLGLEALAIFGQMVLPPSNAQGLNVQVSHNTNEDVYRFRTVNRETALFLQSHQLSSEATNVSFSSTGEGLALVQLNVRYNVKSETENTFIKQVLQTNSTDTRLNLQICASWNGPEETGMMLIEVHLLTGYTLAGDYVEVLKQEIGSIFKKEEFSNNRLSIYLDELTETCFTVKMKSIYFVKDVKPALVKTYRYYAPGVSVSNYYSPTSSSATMDVCHSLFNRSDDDNNQV